MGQLNTLGYNYIKFTLIKASEKRVRNDTVKHMFVVWTADVKHNKDHNKVCISFTGSTIINVFERYNCVINGNFKFL